MSPRTSARYRKWSKEAILDEISQLTEISAKKIQCDRSSLYGAAIRYFGSWKKAVEAAGFDYSRVRKSKIKGYWSPQTVTQKILTLNEKHSAIVRKFNADLYNAALRIFGSWEKAILASGLDYKDVQKEWPSKKGRDLK